ncbi:hypothetical protein VOLCADRAFT_100618 [Volvox carteri f. nagariensis]|uniref:Uncharacterized protein n=1 Tax=Volvox carteri f. nagariensis TaxID=3068 RepID=D8UKN0_VOLCA|nr:uncharacterized protein VOLCADRAFT_100618 [Volvox carteri f. nagariensis]EFJ39707.1 hypothetical protein VOLCADRAFT_100618 [Volvox carteri f. nagariensis]|eukprot:XP_002959214.1 hypothetical protein VOLCADRAFT_100618 [Volvox carteri f. nagariensis]
MFRCSRAAVRCGTNCALNCTFNCTSSCVVGCTLKRASRHMPNCAVQCGQCVAICAVLRFARSIAVRCGAVRCSARAVWRGAVQCRAVRCGADNEAVHGDARGRIARAQAWSSALWDDAMRCTVQNEKKITINDDDAKNEPRDDEGSAPGRKIEERNVQAPGDEAGDP